MAKVLIANPSPRRKRKAPAKRRARTSIARKVVKRRYRRNPSGGKMDAFSLVKKSAVGAGGALLVDFTQQQVTKFLPVPVDPSSPMNALVKGGVSLALGFAVAKVAKQKKLGVEIAEGGLTVALYESMKAPLVNSGVLADDGLLGYDDGLLGYTGVARQF